MSAIKIDSGDVRRMIRALEVSYLSGQPISHRQTQHDRSLSADGSGAFWLHWPRALLHQRINDRTDAMMRSGLVDETKSLMLKFGTLSRTAAQAVGYRETIEVLSQSQSPTAAAIDQCHQQIAAHTRQLARRQETWMRSFGEIQRLEMDPTVDNLIERVVDQIEHRIPLDRLQ